MKGNYLQLIISFILFATVWLVIRRISDSCGILGSRHVSDTSGIAQVQSRNQCLIFYISFKILLTETKT